jgi:hypothetical protein
MAFDISKIAKSRLSSLSNTNKKSDLIWKPKGKQVVRILPYKFREDGYPFIELKFHYNIGKKTYLSPDSFNRPDPIVEWSNRLKRNGGDDWKLGKKIEPKLRTYAPILVRGEENLGVRFWGFGKTVYEELLRVIADPEWGDITDVATGRDIDVEFKEATETGKNFPETLIRVKPRTSPAIDEARKSILDQQTDILELFPEYTYDELKEIMENWISAQEAEADGAVNSGSVVDEESVTPISPSAAASKANSSEVEDQFDQLFGKK